MRTIETTLYTFDELSEEAKQHAIEHFRQQDWLFSWSDDWRQSAETFAHQFGVRLNGWSVGPWSAIGYSHDATNANFRGLKLRDVNRDAMPTGYCGDNDFQFAFYDEFKRTGDALHSFDHAIYEGLKAWRNDWEYAYSEEAIAELISINEYEFTEEGELA